MDIIERLRADLREAKRSQVEALADRMGIPRGTFRKIVSGDTPNPRYNTVQAIQAYYDRMTVAVTLRAADQQVARSERRRQMS